jgi:RNA:NAD 2'-phosphotransferase (TPT1/KptA family)
MWQHHFGEASLLKVYRRGVQLRSDIIFICMYCMHLTSVVELEPGRRHNIGARKICSKYPYSRDIHVVCAKK